jgi:2,3-bisphosphoglycerate-independent phosphoglycerate mutase
VTQGRKRDHLAVPDVEKEKSKNENQQNNKIISTLQRRKRIKTDFTISFREQVNKRNVLVASGRQNKK